ncbi:hypothetical protein ACNHUS_18520 [Actinomycetes bacterium M1A6_2h]
MRALPKTVLVGAAALSLSLSGAGIASAIDYPTTPVVSPDAYLQGNTVYFTSSGLNCSMAPNGVVGCDIPGGMFLTQVPTSPKVYDIAIDVPWFPAHPTFGIGGPRGHGGSTQLEGSLTYGGANCQVGFKGALTCTSMGHSFTAWTPYLTVS